MHILGQGNNPILKTVIAQKYRKLIWGIKNKARGLVNIPHRLRQRFPFHVSLLGTPKGPNFPIILPRGYETKGTGGIGNKNNRREANRDKFKEICDFLSKKYGFNLKQEPIRFVTHEAIEKRTKAIKCEDYNIYLHILKTNKNELQQLLKLIVPPETSFFRTPEQLLRLKTIVPEIIKRKKYDRSLRIWCAGCATGEEVWSIAMILHSLQEEEPGLADWKFEIHATDIVEDFLEIAEKGEYSSQSVKNIKNKEFLSLFNRFTEKTKSKYYINDEIKKTVKIIFKKHNLMKDFNCKPDIIFCRNVLIYFTQERMREVLEKIHERLPKDGYLFLTDVVGAIEGIFRVSLGFKHIGSTIYQKLHK